MEFVRETSGVFQLKLNISTLKASFVTFILANLDLKWKRENETGENIYAEEFCRIFHLDTVPGKFIRNTSFTNHDVSFLETRTRRTL